MFEVNERPLGDKEVRKLQKRIRTLEATIRSGPRRAFGCLGALTVLPFLVVILKPHDPVNRWGALILFGVLAILVAVVNIQAMRELRQEIAKLERAGQGGTVVEYHVVASRCLVVEADDDEGSDYHFDVGDPGTVFLNDTDLKANALPNSDFTLVEHRDERGTVVESSLTCRGKRFEPTYVLHRPDVDSERDYPSLVPIAGTLEDRMRELGHTV